MCAGIAGALLLLRLDGATAQTNESKASAESQSLCPMIEAAARANALPVDFFARLIWRESRFRADAIGPQTRSGARALGIAQFMPATAIEQDLLEPFDPKQALPKSGAFLAELRDEFGNLGLAAAAYNAGAQRVRDFLAGSRGLPEETRNYVAAITGHPVEEWAKADTKSAERTSEKGSSENDDPRLDCNQLLASLDRYPSSLSGKWLVQDLRNVPSWCRALTHPNVQTCGSVHAPATVIQAVLSQSKRKNHSTRAAL